MYRNWTKNHLLLSKKKTDSELINAAKDGDIELVKQEIAKSPDNVDVTEFVGRKIFTPLAAAISNNHFDVVKLLVESKANVNIGDGILIKQPLFFATLHAKNLNIIKYLIENKANVNIKDNFDRGICHYATNNQKLSVLKYFIEEQQLDPNIADNDGNNALMYAAGSGSLETVKYLIEKQKMDLNTKNNSSMTIIHSAIRGESPDNVDIIKYLVEEYNFDTNFKNDILTYTEYYNFKTFQYLLSKIDNTANDYTALLTVLLAKISRGYSYKKDKYKNIEEQDDFIPELLDDYQIGRLLINNGALINAPDALSVNNFTYDTQWCFPDINLPDSLANIYTEPTLTEESYLITARTNNFNV